MYQPDVGILNGNSKNGTMACLLHVLGASDQRFIDASETVAMQVVHAYPAWDSGHTGNGLRVGWEALASSLLPASKDSLVRQHHDAMSWYFDLCRHPLGGFEKVPGYSSDQYLTREWGAVAGLIYTASRKHLRLCGGAPAAHSVLVPIAGDVWGTSADDEMFGIDHFPEYGADEFSIEELRIAGKNPDSHGVPFFERLQYHGTQIYRYKGAQNLAQKFNDGDATALAPLLVALQHDDFRIRRAAMHGFSDHDIDPAVVSAQALPLVADVFLEPNPSWWELHGALGVLAACEPSEIASYRSYLSGLRDFPETWIREEAARAFGAMGDETEPEDVEALAEMYASEPWLLTRSTISKQAEVLVGAARGSGAECRGSGKTRSLNWAEL